MTVYSWSITNGTITSSTTAQSLTYTSGASGDVTLTLTVTMPFDYITPNSLMIPINPIPASSTITPGGPTTFAMGPLSPKGGGGGSSFIVNPSNAAASIGVGGTGGTGVFATTIGTTDADRAAIYSPLFVFHASKISAGRFTFPI